MSRDGLIVFSIGESIFRVSATGGVPVRLTPADPARRGFGDVLPNFLPDGRHFLYTRRMVDPSKSAILIGATDAKPEDQSVSPLVKSLWEARFVP
jgi:hypothetical protein